MQRAVIAVIVINAITIGMETSSSLMDQVGWLSHAVDRLALTIFTVELAVHL
ncbi:hypothetical protein [Nonomuraea sp. KM90]|uniref:hypothetical protein n=1 Tax=Nonomuraea sp. KM90 TaxID=3457428 RepID=UPI003FCD88BB